MAASLPAKLVELLSEGSGYMGDVVMCAVGLGRKQTVKRALGLAPLPGSGVRGVWKLVGPAPEERQEAAGSEPR